MILRTDEDQNWFYVSEGRRQGPLDRRGLVQALLAQDVPEMTLVWRSGLSAWTKAGDLQDLRIELPPPIPGQVEPAVRLDMPPLPTEDGTVATIGLGESDGEEEEDEDDELESPPTDASGAPTGGPRRRRRKRKHKHSEKASRKPRVLELLALFLVLALVLWFLLRRMNQVPEGTIIYQGRLSTLPPPRPPSWEPR